MMVIARVFGISLLAGGLTTWISYGFLSRFPDAIPVAVCIGCVGSVIGALAGAAQEISTALRQRSSD